MDEIRSVVQKAKNESKATLKKGTKQIPKPSPLPSSNPAKVQKPKTKRKHASNPSSKISSEYGKSSTIAVQTEVKEGETDVKVDIPIEVENSSQKAKFPKSSSTKEKLIEDDVRTFYMYKQFNKKNKGLYGNCYVEGFQEFKRLARILGRFPFKCKRNDQNGKWKFYWSKDEGMIFYITSGFIFLLTIIYCWNLLSYVLNYPPIEGTGFSGGNAKNARAEELFIFYRNIGLCGMFGMLLLHVNVANWKTFQGRRFIPQYLNYVTNVLEIVKVNAAEGLAWNIMYINIIFIFLVLLLIFFTCIRISPITTGGPGFLGILLIRFFYPQAYFDPISYPIMRIVAAIIFFYILLCAKVYPILFVYQCKVISGILHVWNEKLELLLNRGKHLRNLERKIAQHSSFKDLHKDHTIILDLIDGADFIFSDSIESYFLTQVLSLLIESYWLWRSIKGEEFFGLRKLDLIFISVYLAHNIVFLYLVGNATSNVDEEARDGLEVIRRRGTFVNDQQTTEELHFILGMQASYSGPHDIAIRGAGFAYIDRSFIVGILATLVSYFGVVIQFSQPLAFQQDHPMNLLIHSEMKLLKHVEDTKVWLPQFANSDDH